MNEVFVIPDELVFSPCKVDGLFWKQFHILLSYLGQPDELAKLKEENVEEYNEVISGFVTFIKETENELHSKNLLVKVDLDQLKQN